MHSKVIHFPKNQPKHFGEIYRELERRSYRIGPGPNGKRFKKVHFEIGAESPGVERKKIK